MGGSAVAHVITPVTSTEGRAEHGAGRALHEVGEAIGALVVVALGARVSKDLIAAVQRLAEGGAVAGWFGGHHCCGDLDGCGGHGVTATIVLDAAVNASVDTVVSGEVDVFSKVAEASWAHNAAVSVAVVRVVHELFLGDNTGVVHHVSLGALVLNGVDIVVGGARVEETALWGFGVVLVVTGKLAVTETGGD